MQPLENSLLILYSDHPPTARLCTNIDSPLTFYLSLAKAQHPFPPQGPRHKEREKGAVENFLTLLRIHLKSTNRGTGIDGRSAPNLALQPKLQNSRVKFRIEVDLEAHQERVKREGERGEHKDRWNLLNIWSEPLYIDSCFSFHADKNYCKIRLKLL